MRRSPASRFGVARSASARTLVAIDLAGALACLLAASAPRTAVTTRHNMVGFGAMLAVLAALVWLVAPLSIRLAERGGAALTIGVISAVVARAPTPEGAVVASFTYVWVAIYAASFLARRVCYAVLGLILLGAGAGLGANDVPRWIGIWILVVLTTSVTGVVLERSVGQLRREAETDALTGLLNRRGFAKAAELERSLSERAGFELALAVIDLDNFKAVNDSAGHAAGDAVLADAARSWRAALRDGDLLARRGGDEFTAIFPVGSELEADSALVRLRGAHPIAWTAGVVLLSKGEPLERAIARADERLYQAKLRSRGAEELSSWDIG